MDEFGDNWNPLLVREVRRLLKSRLFLGSFLLLLFSCWISCLYLVITAGDSLVFLEMGGYFCFIYFFILQVSLCIIAPLSVFFVSAQERIENTIETVAMTTLKRSQVINGLLWCGVIQAGLFYSAVIPFISFGYLLKGVDILQILAGIFISAFFSGFSGIWCLMLGVTVRSPVSHIICLIFSLLGGIACFGISFAFLSGIFSSYGASAIWQGEFLCGFFCLALPAFFLTIIFLDIADRRIRIKDPNRYPYQVILDEQGNILRFKRSPRTTVFDEIPELQASLDEKKKQQQEQENNE